LGEGSAESVNNSNFSVTHEDFQNYSWQKVIETAECKQCHNYYGLFFGKVAELEKAGDERGCRVFRFLGAITSLHSRYDIITSKLNSELIQEVRHLETLLKLPETIEVFGANAIFDLRDLLVEKFGHNLRNRLTHGLMHEGHFYSTEAVYIWWLVLRFCCVPLILLERQAAAESSKEQNA
jgi:hypothetical protein